MPFVYDKWHPLFLLIEDFKAMPIVPFGYYFNTVI